MYQTPFHLNSLLRLIFYFTLSQISSLHTIFGDGGSDDVTGIINHPIIIKFMLKYHRKTLAVKASWKSHFLKLHKIFELALNNNNLQQYLIEGLWKQDVDGILI